MELLSLKIMILTLSGAIRIIFGMLPMVLMRSITRKFGKNSWLQKVISLLMFFGGGVLLATCFLHMMPEVRESFQSARPDSVIPIAEIIFIIGFFWVYLLEDVIHGCIDRRRHNKKAESKTKDKVSKNKKSKDTETGSPTMDDRIFQANLNGAYQSTGDITASTTSIPGFRPLSEVQKNLTTRHSSYHGEIPVGGVNVLPRLNKSPSPDYTEYKLKIAEKNMKNDPNNENLHCFGVEKFSYVDPDWWRDTVIANSQMNLLSTSSFSVGGKHTDDVVGKTIIDNQSTKCQKLSPSGSTSPSSQSSSLGRSSGTTTTDSHSADSGHGSHSHSHVPITGSDEDDATIGGSIRNLLIVIAISFHGIFEGLAIGLQPTAKDVWYLFMAVSLHECTILFCIGVELISSKTRVFRMITYILVVSLVNPIGIAVGIVVSENSFSDVSNHALIVGCFQGMAAGTLLYVTFFEIFVAEGKKLHSKHFHIITALLGFTLMAGLEFIGGHNHSHKSQSHSLNGTILDEHGDHDHDSHAPTGFHGKEDHHDHHDHEHNH